MEKNYKENEERKALIENSIQNISMPEELRPIIIDILMRRYYEFEFSEEQIENELLLLSQNLKKIEIDKMPKGYENAAGLCFQNEGRILIKESYVANATLDESKVDVYETVAHELFHALCLNQYGEDILVSQNQFGVWNTSLREAIVEKAADRCVYGRKSDEKTAPYFHQNKCGYSDITFIIDAIAASYGVTEKDLLKNALLGRDSLIDFLSSSARENPEKTTLFLDAIEINYNRLYKAEYPFGNEQKLKPREKKNAIIDTVGGIYSICEAKLQERLEQTQFETGDAGRKQLEEFEFSHNKLTSVMEHTLKGFDGQFTLAFISKKVNDSVLANRKKAMRYISNMSKIMSLGLSPEIENYLIEAVQDGKVEDDPEYLLRYGITAEVPEKMFELSEELVSQKRSENFEEIKWDNSLIVEGMKAVTRLARKKFDIKEVIENIQTNAKDGIEKIKSIFNKTDTPKLLEDGNQENKDSKPNIFKLDTKEMQEFRKGEEKILTELGEKAKILDENNKNTQKDDKDEIQSLDDD